MQRKRLFGNVGQSYEKSHEQEFFNSLEGVMYCPKDLLDIRGLIQNQPNLNRDRIRNWVKPFAELLSKPELRNGIEGYF